jgi:hypothetical protein
VVSKTNAFRMFELHESEKHKTKVNRPMQFRLCIHVVAHNVSFCHGPSVRQATNETSGISALGSANTCHVTKNVRVLCLLSLRLLSDMPRVSWLLSTSLHTSTAQDTGHLDIRSCVLYDWSGSGELLNLSCACVTPGRASHSRCHV